MTCDDGGRQVERERRAEAQPAGVLDEVVAAGREPGEGEPDVGRHLGRADQVERPGRHAGVLADPEALDDEAVALRPGAGSGTSSSGVIAPEPRAAIAVTILNTEPGT